MVSALDSRARGLGLSLGWGHCVVFFGKTLTLTVPLSTQVYVGTSEFNAGGNPAMDSHPIQEGVEILLVASRYRNQDRLWPVGLYLLPTHSQ